jgi:putative phosphoesterase
MPYYMSGDTDIVIYGHTHIFEQKYLNGTLFINPGEVCAREKPLIECVVLEIKDNKYIINYNYKNININIWETKKFEYDRQ